ncbi:MAG: helix-turn-helix domain-containing protein [Ktedonobacterales bacterium]
MRYCGAAKTVRKAAGKKAGGSRTPIRRGRLNSPELMKVLLTVEETAHKLSVGRSAVYGLMRRGELRYITVGRVRRVPIEAVSEFVAHARAHSAA